MKDKTAIINAAQKFASKGNIDKAIAEWEKLLSNGTDGNIQNTIGDLYLKKGAEAQAVEAFAKAAETFRKDGFYPKAIAIHKKILNITPNSVDSLIALAKLHATRGLNSAAADYYFKAADQFHRNGYTEKAGKTVDMILKLSSTDIATRQKIADWYIKSGMRQRAANEYAAIAENYLRKEDVDNAENFFTKACELDPDSIDSLTGLSRLAEKKGDSELAFKHLEKALSSDPESKETLLTYAELAIKTGKNDKARETLLNLIERSPANTRARKLLGELCLDENKTEEAWEHFLPCIDEAVNEKKWKEAVDMLDRFREYDPVGVRERIVEIYRSADDKENLAKEILELGAVYESQGSQEDALRAYRGLIETDPDNTAAAEKIRELEAISEPESPAEPEPESIAEPEPEPSSAPADKTGDMRIRIDPETAEDHAVEKIIPGQEPAAERQEPSHSEAILEKKKEAEFFARQGLNEEAAAIYRELLESMPDNAEIKQRLEALQTASGPAEEVVVKKIYDAGDEKHDEPDTASAAEELQNIFDTFAKNEDYEARYRAGLEAKQKGRLDEAIRQFRTAAEDPDKKLVSKSMIAICFMEKGAYADAVIEFSQVLESMSPGDASYLQIKYELAGAYRKNGNEKKALELYKEISEKDPDFREVGKKIGELRPAPPETAQQQETVKSDTAKTEEPGTTANGDKPKKKKNRISYI